MEKVCNVANWFLSQENMTHKKIQKLCYYAQAWSCALYGEPMFPDEIQAWVHGPVIPSLYPVFADYKWEEIPRKKCECTFTKKVLKVLNAVYATYGKLSGDQLERLTHSEDPWKIARGDLEPWVNGTQAISLEDMKVYYGQKYEEAQND